MASTFATATRVKEFASEQGKRTARYLAWQRFAATLLFVALGFLCFSAYVGLSVLMEPAFAALVVAIVVGAGGLAMVRYVKF